MRRMTLAMFTAIIALAFALPALAAPPEGKGNPIVVPPIWADGEQFGTILRGPLPYNGNDHSFDTLYMFPDGEQTPVAEAAPGKGYNGGRWIPTHVTWNVEPYLLTSAAAVHAAYMAGDVTIGDPMTDAAFLCPLIPNR